MILQITASSDAYITNKIIDSKTRATDANVGRASTIDLFKLYNEPSIEGEDEPIELSRGLIKFELSDLSASMKDKVLFNDPSLKIYLELFDVQGTQVAPEDFTICVYPLSKSFDEGLGSDVVYFNDLDRVNWVTSSYSSGANALWTLPGAKLSGSLGSTNIDVISSGSLTNQTSPSAAMINLTGEQYFKTGRENLKIDITTLASASMCGFLPDEGFLLAYSGSEEWDSKSRFVKRFASRHTRNPYKKPRIRAEWDDSIIDYHNILEFGASGSLYFYSYDYNQLTNLVSGSKTADSSALESLTGPSCLELTLATGSFTASFDAGQALINGIYKTGIYSSSFALSQFDQTTTSHSLTLKQHLAISGSITMTERWKDATHKSHTYLERDIIISAPKRSTSKSRRDLRFSILDLKSEYTIGNSSRVRVFVRDRNLADEPSRTPIKLESISLKEAYYQIKDADNNETLVDFIKSDTTNATRINSDSNGMWFDLPINLLPTGKAYTINILVNDRGATSLYETHTRFRVK